MKEDSALPASYRAAVILRELAGHYPQTTALEFSSPFQLLVATILSAQCTDKKVNQVTKDLWIHYPTPESVASAPIEKLEAVVKPTGYYRQKARTIQACCQALISRFGGGVPPNLDELTSLPGVGRKTANLVLSNALGIPGVVVDTHVSRVSQRLGLTTSTRPEKIETDLMALVPEEAWGSFSNLLIRHGRAVCTARNPRCPSCPIARWCPSTQSFGRSVSK